MDDEPMWAADHVVALTPGSVITIPETVNEFAIKVIRVKQKQFNHKIGTERMIFNIDSAMKHSHSNDDTCFSINVIDKILEEDFDSLLEEGYFQIPIDPNDQEKTTFTCPFGTYAYRRMHFGLCNAPATFQRCKLAIFHDMIEELVKVFMDDIFVFGNSFKTYLNNLDKMLQHCKDAHLVLNWEKCLSMVKEGIVLGHKVASARLKVEKAKIDVISKPPPHSNIKDTPFEFDDKCQKAFELLKEKLTCAPVIVSPNWNLPFELMCDASDFAVGAVLGIEIKDRKGTENAAVDHLSRIENDALVDDSEVDDNFLEETLIGINTKDEPWFADFANYLVGGIIPKGMTYQQKNNFFLDLKHYFREDPYLFKGASFTQGIVSSIPIGGNISLEGFLLPILLVVVIIVMVVIVVVILIVVVAIIGVVVVVGGVFIIKLSFVIIVTFPSMLLGDLVGLLYPIGWAYAFHQYKASSSGGGIISLIGDEDPTDEDGDAEVLVSLGEISSEEKKSWKSDIGDCDNTRDGGKTAGRAIIT
nr:reverse transcriptase domain-containing protein [Tanacetum cinerariifolium]